MTTIAGQTLDCLSESRRGNASVEIGVQMSHTCSGDSRTRALVHMSLASLPFWDMLCGKLPYTVISHGGGGEGVWENVLISVPRPPVENHICATLLVYVEFHVNRTKYNEVRHSYLRPQGGTSLK